MMSMTTSPPVSVLLPCHDAAAYLPDTIESLQAQSFQRFEVIAVDDGSTDDTAKLLAAWAGSDPRVRVFTQAHGGIVAALQRAVDEARGEILVRMDADDIAYSSRIEKQVGLLTEQPEIGACGTLIRYFPRDVLQGGAQRYEQWINRALTHDEIVREMFVECPIAHPTMAVRRDVLLQAGGYRDNGWPEDYDLVFRLWLHGVRFAKVPEVLLRWRERPDRASRTDPRYSEDAFRRVKVHFLKQSLLRDRQVVVWGAGPVGKAFAAELRAQNVDVVAFIDVDTRKVGNTMHDAPVLTPEELHGYSDAFVVAAVGQSAGREEIRAFLAGLNRSEGRDFVAVA
jgi:glycosyltransferase involved in cell wall biosynthesis